MLARGLMGACDPIRWDAELPTSGLPREGEEPAAMDDDAKLSALLMELYHAEGRTQVLELVDELSDAGALAKPPVVTSMLKARQL